VRTAIGPGPLAFTTVRGLQIDEPGVRSLVDQVGLDGVRPGEVASYRPLHGYVLSKLAEAKPSVVAIDIAFADRDDPGDAAMVAGIQALRAGGCAVVVGLYNWPSQTPDPVTLDPDILADNPRGAPTGQFLRSGWRLDTAAKMPGDALASPSFALAAVAALRMPAVPYTVRFDPAAAEVVLSPSAADVGTGHVIRTEHRVGVSFFREDAGRSGMLPNGTLVAYSVLDVPPFRDIDDATVNIADLPKMSPGELSELFFQRVVVIGQAASQADRVTHPSGEPIEGFKAQMVAIEALAKSRFIRRVTPSTHVLSMAIAAFGGVVLAFGGPRSTPMRAVLLVAALLTVCATTVLLLAVGVGFVDPLPVMAALVVTYFAALWIRGVRLVRGFLPWTNRAPALGNR
ncbi:MAG: CHASE2 domain-containing protein, partial [Phycisphaerales bacterium JB041]